MATHCAREVAQQAFRVEVVLLFARASHDFLTESGTDLENERHGGCRRPSTPMPNAKTRRGHRRTHYRTSH
jgi:hypothetical protein